MVHLQYCESKELKLKSLNIFRSFYMFAQKRDLSGFHWRAIGQRRACKSLYLGGFSKCRSYPVML